MDFLKAIDSNTFFKDFFEKKPLQASIEEESWFYQEQKNIDIDNILTSQILSTNFIQLIQSGNTIPSEKYTTSIQMTRGIIKSSVDIEKVISLFDQGNTILIPSIQDLSINIRKICIYLENFFSLKVRANAYITPPNSFGLKPHSDDHDVLIYQLRGNKKWTLGKLKQYLPLRANHNPENGDNLGQYNINQGDILYLPRGTIHSAETNSETSIHITFSIYPWRIADLAPTVANLLIENILENNENFRKSINIHNHDSLNDKVTDDLVSLFEAFHNKDVIKKYVKELMIQHHLDRLTDNSKIFNSLLKSQQFEMKTVWIFQKDKIFKITDEEEVFTIHLKDKFFKFDKVFYSILLDFMSKKSLSTEEILKTNALHITNESILNFLKILIKNSIITTT